MLGCSISFVRGKTVERKLSVELLHDAVPGDFGNYAGSGNTHAAGVAANHGSLGNGKRMDGEAVNEGVIRFLRKGQNGLPHGLVGGSKNIQTIDFRNLDDSHGIPHPAVIGQGKEQLLTFPGTELF